MNEAEALLKIAAAINHLAAAVDALGFIALLTLLFKDQSSNSVASAIRSVFSDRGQSRKD